jgi:hypothetical protein
MKGSTMSTLPPCAEHGNPTETTDYTARTSGHADGSVPFEDDHDLHRAMLAQQDHEQAIDWGDDAVNADAAMAEAKLREAFPRAESVIVAREQERLWHRQHGGSFQARWSVFVSPDLYASAATLDAAVAAVLAKAGVGDVPPTLLVPAAASVVASAG